MVATNREVYPKVGALLAEVPALRPDDGELGLPAAPQLSGGLPPGQRVERELHHRQRLVRGRAPRRRDGGLRDGPGRPRAVKRP